ncbi:MAG TPA: cobyric acid synthase CobQ [Nitrospiraceae bacterium]|nr:cobyric acid synthase CobQ [Nitrospiraceae bacterium]
MALNSFITSDGGEIGRAQALQAEASRTEPTVDMNPVLLKASGEVGSQVIIQGKVYGTMKAQQYYASKAKAWEAIKASYDRLSKKYQLILMEGAGSPAEINLMNVDIVNMAAAKYAAAPVVLVGDIDKGGVFASLYGTVKLLGRDSRHVRAFVINKFRGDIEILKPGLEMIKAKTGKPVIGVLPYIDDVGLPEEDGLALQRTTVKRGYRAARSGMIKIVVIRLKYISNFTDFDPLACEPDVELLYSQSPADIENADLVILPGSKNTIKDLLLLMDSSLDRSIKRAYAKGIQIVGMCGGYQMLGKKILDPYGVETSQGAMKGMGLLNIMTSFEHKKITCQVEAAVTEAFPFPVHEIGHLHKLRGYEIHMGISSGDIGLFRVKRLSQGEGEIPDDGVLTDGSINGNCWGTYLHGIFENDRFRRGLLNHIRKQKNLPPLGHVVNYRERKEKAISALAGIVRENINLDFVREIIGL